MLSQTNEAKKNSNESSDLKESTEFVDLNFKLKKSSSIKYRMNNDFLMAFLHYSHLNVDDAKKRLDQFYSHKQMYPEMLMNRQLSEPLLRLYRQGIHVIPEKSLAPEGPPRLIISQYYRGHTQENNPKEIFKLLFMLGEILANEDPKTSETGIIYIIDARNMTHEIMKQYDAQLIKHAWKYLEKSMPLRIIEMHVINMRKEGLEIFEFVKAFMPTQMKMKFMIHKKAEDLYAHIPRDAMTVEYGGHNGYQALALKHWEYIMLNKYKEYFDNDDEYGINGKLRIGNNATNLEVSQLTGLNGSFRKLTVD